jgi:hypothetical protein
LERQSFPAAPSKHNPAPSSGVLFDRSAGWPAGRSCQLLRKARCCSASNAVDHKGYRRNSARNRQLTPLPISQARSRSQRHGSCGPGRTCRRCRWRAASRAARARLTRLLIVPTAVSQMAAASSWEKPDAPTRMSASRWSGGRWTVVGPMPKPREVIEGGLAAGA